jgi:hypothetical protein
MSNTWGGTDDTLIAQAGFESFKAALAPFRAFSTNFSAEAANKSTAVTTRIITGMTAGSFSGDYETGDTTTTAISISLSNHSFRAFHMTDVEDNKSSVAGGTMEMQAKEAAYSVAKKIFADTLSVVTNANYSTAAFVGAASGFDSDDVIDIADILDDADASNENRSLILSNAYFTALRKDASVKGRDGVYGSDAFNSGVLPNIGGFTVYRSNAIPANSENLVGFACVPAGIAVAVRPVRPQSGAEKVLESFQIMTDPETGLSLGYRSWYSAKTGTKWGAFEAVYGYAKANAAGLKRITSA